MSKFLQTVLSVLILSSAFIASEALAERLEGNWILTNRSNFVVTKYVNNTPFDVMPNSFVMVRYQANQKGGLGGFLQSNGIAPSNRRVEVYYSGSMEEYDRNERNLSSAFRSGAQFLRNPFSNNNNQTEEVVVETPPPIEPSIDALPTAREELIQNEPVEERTSRSLPENFSQPEIESTQASGVMCDRNALSDYEQNTCKAEVRRQAAEMYRMCRQHEIATSGNETAIDACVWTKNAYEGCDIRYSICAMSYPQLNEKRTVIANAIELGSGAATRERDNIEGDTPETINSADLLAEVETQKKACYDSRTNAINCCGSEALSCVDGGNGSNETQLAAMAAQIAAMYSTGNSAGLKQQCDAYQRMQATSGALTGRAAQVCGFKRNSCENSCSQYQTSLASLVERCGQDEECRHNIEAQIGVATERKLICTEDGSLRRQQDELMIATSSSFANVAVATQCSGAVAQQSVDSNGDPVNPALGVEGCSSPENASNPYCLSQTCSQPGSENLPQCGGNQPMNPTVPTSPGGGFANGSPSTGSDSGADFFANSPSQNFDGNPNSNALNNEPNSLVSVQGGGGSGAPGSGGGGGSAASSGGSGGVPSASSRGYNTKILKGARGGSGYSVSRGSTRSGGGGFKGYGRGSKSKSSSYKPLSLKDFLPGGKKDPRRKGASASRSVASTGEVINVSHSDIWKKMSSKYSEVCLRKQLTCSGRKSRIPLKQ